MTGPTLMSSWEERQAAKSRSVVALFEPSRHEHSDELIAWGTNWTDVRCLICGRIVGGCFTIVLSDETVAWEKQMGPYPWPLDECPWWDGPIAEGDGTSADF